jgi:probable HAF family extracellular repeat protein
LVASFLDAGSGLTAFGYPGALQTIATGINDSGQIVGYYYDGTALNGFVDTAGVFATFAYPGVLVTWATGINNSGQIVGAFNNGSEWQGYLYSAGVFTTLDDPNATGGTVATGINDSGQIVGYFYEGTMSHGFVYSGASSLRLTTLAPSLVSGKVPSPPESMTAGRSWGISTKTPWPKASWTQPESLPRSITPVP